MRRLTCDSGVEVLGAPMLSFAENLANVEIQPYLEKYGLTSIVPDQWYPMQVWLDVLNDLAVGTNLTSQLVAIGLEIFKNVKLPPQLESATLPDILAQWDTIYHMQHRGGDIGYVEIEKITDTHYKSSHKHLYPDDMTYGVAYGMARRFLPKGTRFTVFYDKDVPHMDEGGAITIIHMEWS